jgi:transcriptional regulator of acetoin/glycerol metabolism
MQTPVSWESFVSDMNGAHAPGSAPRTAAVPASAAPRTADEHSPFELSQELMRSAADVLRSTEDALSGTTSWLALADASGVVTYEWASNSELKHLMTRADVEAGVQLAEDIVGPNGIGTALATRSRTLVKGVEHANERWYDLACGASPVIHPVSRALMGIVNVTCLAGEHNQHLKITLNSMVAGIQHSLLARSRTRHQRLLDAHLRVRKAARGSIVTLDAFTMIVEDDLGGVVDRQSLWELIESVGPLATELSLPSGQRVQVVPVVPGRLTEGCSLVFERRRLGDLEGVARMDALDAPPRRDRLSPLEQAEYDVIVSVLRDAAGNKSEAAAQLHISRGTLYERLRRYGVSA